jgi:hypothetical protein
VLANLNTPEKQLISCMERPYVYQLLMDVALGVPAQLDGAAVSKAEADGWRSSCEGGRGTDV